MSEAESCRGGHSYAHWRLGDPLDPCGRCGHVPTTEPCGHRHGGHGCTTSLCQYGAPSAAPDVPRYRAHFSLFVAAMRQGCLVKDDFIDRLAERMEAGWAEYGDVSFDRPIGELLGEIREELTDVPGWGLILFTALNERGYSHKYAGRLMDVIRGSMALERRLADLAADMEADCDE